MNLALKWRCDGSNGIHWFLRGIRDDGAFYGEVLRLSAGDPCGSIAMVSGQLSAIECSRLAALVAVIEKQRSPVKSGPPFAVLFERLSPTNLNDVRRILEYHCGDEANSEPARAFVELAGLVERHLVPFYADLVEPTAAPDRGDV